MRVAVVGGGITGLTAAWRLQQSGASLEVILLEQQQRLGGCIHTERSGGFVIEHGPDVFLARKPEALALCAELGIPVEETDRQNRGVFIRRGDVLHRMPEGLSGLVPTRLGPLLRSRLLSVRGRARVLMDLVKPGRSEQGDLSVSEFFVRRLGKEAFIRLIAPLLTGIAGGNPDTLSMKALYPNLLTLEKRSGSVLMGLVPDDPGRGSPFRSIPGGLSTLVDMLAARLGSEPRTGFAASRIARDENAWQVHMPGDSSIRADAVVLAVPAWSAGPMLTPVDPQLAEELMAIPHNSTVAVNMAFRKEDVAHPLDGYGYLVSQQEATRVVACTWSSSKLAGRAPAEHVLFRVFLAGKDALNQSNESLEKVVRSELSISLGITSAPLFMRVKRYERALPQYVLGHPERCRRIQECLAQHRGLFVAGPMFDGIGIPDCIRQGTQAAKQVLDYLSSRH